MLVGRKYHGKCIQAVASRHTEPCSAVVGECLSESFVLLSQQIPSALYDSCHFCSQFRLEAFVQTFQVEILDIAFARRKRTDVYFVSIITYCATSEAFFLMDEPLVQVSSTIFVGGSEVDVVVLLVAFVDEMTEEQVECAVCAPFFAAGYVLHMCYFATLEYYDAGYDALFVSDDIQAYVLGELAHQQCHLLQCVCGTCVVILLEHALEQSPVLSKCFDVSFDYAVDVEAVVDCLACLSHAQGGHLHGIAHGDAGAHQSACQSGSCTEEGVEFLA